MTKEGLISEKLRGMIGKELPVTQTTELNRKLVADFIGAINDPNSEFTKEIEYSEVVPPNILMVRGVSYKGSATASLASELPPGALDAGGEFEVLKPVRIGDVIVVDRMFGDIYEKKGSMGNMIFCEFETTYRNQRGEIVAKGKWRGIRIPAPEVSDYEGRKVE